MRAENFKKWIEEKLSNESCNGKKIFGHDNDRQSNFLEFSRNPGTKTCMFLRRIPMQKKISDQKVAHFLKFNLEKY